jgi:uncharacterized protein YodC (DUF2158 family)
MVKKRTPEAVAEEAASQCCSCEIAVGGTVYLKSGGPKMTVSGMGWAPGTVTTVWFDGGRLGSGVFPRECLVTYNPASPKESSYGNQVPGHKDAD